MNLGNFIIPTRFHKKPFDFENVRVTAIIPTYKPEALTLTLIENLMRWNDTIRVVVVDDCTPGDYAEGAAIFARLRAMGERVTLLRTPVNRMKAGALNWGLAHVFAEGEARSAPIFKSENWGGARTPDVILSLDDDVVVTSSTVKNLVTELMSYEQLGAVCSQCRVLNKNTNLLTRLQGLEYVGFNATRLADEGFYRGPLVMHGMLTAFRVAALRGVGQFAERHLIEDYEITTRLKSAGWSVKLAANAPAWTVVPERFRTFWRQRTRWSYGGITVIVKTKRLSSVIQDVIGHTVFFATLAMIALMLFFQGSDTIPVQIARWVVLLSFLQLGLWYGFQLWLMRSYAEKDARDWIIRVSLIPEFIYANILTVIVIGSYFFLLYNVLTSSVRREGGVAARRLVAMGQALFALCGYTESWGTRTQ